MSEWLSCQIWRDSVEKILIGPQRLNMRKRWLMHCHGREGRCSSLSLFLPGVAQSVGFLTILVMALPGNRSSFESQCQFFHHRIFWRDLLWRLHSWQRLALISTARHHWQTGRQGLSSRQPSCGHFVCWHSHCPVSLKAEVLWRRSLGGARQWHVLFLCPSKEGGVFESFLHRSALHEIHKQQQQQKQQG